MGDPLALKSARAQRLYAHLRHPVCLELGVVLWLLPTFPLDRFLLAGYLTVYLALAHSLDSQDCTYLSVQLRSKMQLFSLPPGGSGQVSPTTANNNNNNNHKRDWIYSIYRCHVCWKEMVEETYWISLLTTNKQTNKSLVFTAAFEQKKNCKILCSYPEC